MKFINNTNENILLERWVMSPCRGMASVECVEVKPNEESELLGSQMSIYDETYGYIGCLYDRPRTYKQLYYLVDDPEYRIEQDQEQAQVARLFRIRNR
jgi:hypothetical protein